MFGQMIVNEADIFENVEQIHKIETQITVDALHIEEMYVVIIDFL